MTGTKSRLGRAAAFALALALCAIVWFGIAREDARPSGLMRDFNAFYCAGRAVAQHTDPYRAEPLGSCEREPKPAPLLTGAPALAMPAPLPPYALLPFAALSRLPYVIAAIVWLVSVVLCVAVAVFATRRATGMSLLPLAAAFALTDGYASLALGQVAPVAVAAIALAAMLLAENRDRAAGCAAAVAMIEPHIGLPVCLAMFVLRSRSRLVLITAAIACALASFVFVGGPTTLEYFRVVIPAHGLSEVVNDKQFSLTYALHRINFADAAALRAGEWSYFLMLLIGIALARTLAKRIGDPGAIAALPPALALVGGPFVHIVQMAAALPAAFLLYRHASAGARRALGCAIVLLAIPWVQFINLGTIFVMLAPLVAAILVGTLVTQRPFAVVAGAALAFLFVQQLIAEELSFLSLHGVPSAAAALIAQYDPKVLAETSWTLYVRAIGTANVPLFDISKIPTLLGLAILGVVACFLALRPMKSGAARFPREATWNGAEASRRIATR